AHRQHRHDLPVETGGGSQGVPAPDRSRRALGRSGLGERRPAQPERPDRVPAAQGAAGGGPRAAARRPRQGSRLVSVPGRGPRLVVLALVLFCLGHATWTAWDESLTTDEPLHLSWSRRL